MGGDHFNKLVDQFGSKTGTVHIDLLGKKIVDRFHVRRNRLRFGRRGEGFQLLLQAGNLVISLFVKATITLLQGCHGVICKIHSIYKKPCDGLKTYHMALISWSEIPLLNLLA